MRIILIILILSFSNIALTYAKNLNPLSNDLNSIDAGKKLYAIKCQKNIKKKKKYI